MSQVLRYGFPTEAKLLCENPVCEALATRVAELPLPPGIDTTKPNPEICGCLEHFYRLISGRRVIKMHVLRVAGQRNKA